jgi:metal-responsive CopG/Arc/MetJ family transcriptional regulator
MSMTRTQIYLPEDLRRRVDERAEAEGKPMAEVVREALEHHLTQRPDDVQGVLDATFGAVQDAGAPSRDEWDRA